MLILCEREILLAGCSEDEANRVRIYTNNCYSDRHRIISVVLCIYKMLDCYLLVPLNLHNMLVFITNYCEQHSPTSTYLNGLNNFTTRVLPKCILPPFQIISRLTFLTPNLTTRLIQKIYENIIKFNSLLKNLY